MNSKFSILLLLFVLTYNNGFSCDCYYVGGFAYSNQTKDLVVLGEIVENNLKQNSLSIVIHKNYRGFLEKDTIMLTREVVDCSPNFSMFQKGSIWLFAIDNSRSKYRISNCGENYLNVKNEYVEGRFYGLSQTEQFKTLTLEEVESIILEPYKFPFFKSPQRLKNSYYVTEEYYFQKSNLGGYPLGNYEEVNDLINTELYKKFGHLKLNLNYLVHVNITIMENGSLIYQSIQENTDFSFPYLLGLEKPLKEIVNKLHFDSAVKKGKKVKVNLSIPVLINL
ncbi:hypothetical protein [Flammeovirga sp. SJP92]|uniref:hypothetical protein n=1 Tax=Flammeovirga sp. SJP92 TaxID=1775430 RepID=UPI00078697D5|nr:hypothetical protein [Flammeovirga sp. SJP92]KXX69363.1 hypothetical protein AVL50_19410 [Flammeovirga sp. SJP92]